MKEEFAAYGLPAWSVWVVGAFKILFALGLLAGMALPVLVNPAAIGLGIFMLGAFAMHLKVKDPLNRAVPSLAVLGVCVAILVL